MSKDTTYLVLAIRPALTPAQLRDLIRSIKRNAQVVQIDSDPYAMALAEYEYRRGIGERASLREIAEDHDLSYNTLRKRNMRRNHERDA